jgi:superfamily II DNA/RNA helicase
MDVADIEIVVQYKATCDLCTLWQRFGRAARGANREGTVILLYEKKDISPPENREAIVMAGEKRTADEELLVEAPPLKRSRTSTDPGPTIASSSSEAAATGGQETGGQRKAKGGKARRKGDAAEKTTNPAVGTGNEKATKIKQKKHAYLKADHAALKSQSSLKKPQSSKWKARAIDDNLNGPMADFINVPSLFSCRREVLMVYFGNDKIGDYLRTNLKIESFSRQSL